MNETRYYVITVVGYEGIDVIYSVTTDRDIAISVVGNLRDKIRWVNSLTDEEREAKNLDWSYMCLWLKDPERVCVMSKDETYKCVCDELGVNPKETILY